MSVELQHKRSGQNDINGLTQAFNGQVQHFTLCMACSDSAITAMQFIISLKGSDRLAATQFFYTVQS